MLFFNAVPRGEINIPGGESPRGMRKKVGGPHTAHKDRVPHPRWIKSMSNSSSAPGWMRDLAGKRRKPWRKAAGGVVRMVSHAWGYKVDELGRKKNERSLKLFEYGIQPHFLLHWSCLDDNENKCKIIIKHSAQQVSVPDPNGRSA